MIQFRNLWFSIFGVFLAVFEDHLSSLIATTPSEFIILDILEKVTKGNTQKISSELLDKNSWGMVIPCRFFHPSCKHVSNFNVTNYTSSKMNMTLENPSFEDVFRLGTWKCFQCHVSFHGCMNFVLLQDGDFLKQGGRPDSLEVRLPKRFGPRWFGNHRKNRGVSSHSVFFHIFLKGVGTQHMEPEASNAIWSHLAPHCMELQWDAIWSHFFVFSRMVTSSNLVDFAPHF